MQAVYDEAMAAYTDGNYSQALAQFLHLAEHGKGPRGHARDLPEPVREAGNGEPDPDRRVMRMIGARVGLTPAKPIAEDRGNGVATAPTAEKKKGHHSVA